MLTVFQSFMKPSFNTCNAKCWVFIHFMWSSFYLIWWACVFVIHVNTFAE